MNQPAGASPASSPMLTEQKEDQPLPSTPVMKQVPQLSQPDQNLALARQLARDDPQMVASVVRHWVAGHE
jgi:flagellar M-ring protein FliF